MDAKRPSSAVPGRVVSHESVPRRSAPDRTECDRRDDDLRVWEIRPGKSLLEKYYFSRHPQVVDSFRRDLSRAAFTIIRLADDEVESAANLLRAHPEYNLGAADAIHLATALAVLRQNPPETPFVLVTADNGLAEAARDSGLTVFNPLYRRPEDLERLHDVAA